MTIKEDTAMSKELAIQQDWDEKKVKLLKDTICKGSTNDEFELFIHACKRTGLDPFMKQVHAVKRWDSNLGREVMSIQTGIDGYRLIAERTGCYAPGREPIFVYDENKKLISATSFVKKRTKDGTWHEISHTAFYDEYVQTKKDGKPTAFWLKMPHGQLAKCAEALALRKAFPAELSGIYTTEEMSQATSANTELVAEVIEEKEITQEERAKFLQSFGDDHMNFCQYIEFISVKKNCDIEKALQECIKKEEATRKVFEKIKNDPNSEFGKWKKAQGYDALPEIEEIA